MAEPTRYESEQQMQESIGMEPEIGEDFAWLEDARLARYLSDDSFALHYHDGESVALGKYDPAAMNGLVQMRKAELSLKGESLDGARLERDCQKMDRPGAEEMIKQKYSQRKRVQKEYSQELERASFHIQDMSKMRSTSKDALHRDYLNHGETDWPRISTAVNEYIHAGGDVLDREALRDHLQSKGLDEAQTKWARSLIDDPVRVDHGVYGNGRHRTEAMRAQGVDQVLVKDRSRLQYDRDWEAKTLAGVKVDEICKPPSLSPTHALADPNLNSEITHSQDRFGL